MSSNGFLEIQKTMAQETVCKEQFEHLMKNCILLPGRNETRVWYEHSREQFYYVKSIDRLACGLGMILGNSGHNECNSTWSLAEINDFHSVDYKHSAFSLKEAYHLCYNWAMELMSCAVRDPSWLAVGVGAVSTFVPKGIISPPSTHNRTSQVERALLLAQGRNAEQKNRYLATFSVENFTRFCSAVNVSSFFKDVEFEDRTRWESFSQLVTDLVAEALNWKFVSLTEELKEFLSLQRLTQDVPITPLMSQKPSSSLRLDGQNDANGDLGPLSADEDVVHPELSRELFTGTQVVFLKANQEPAKGFQVTTSAGGHSLKKRCAPLDDIDHEKVTQKSCTVDRVASKTTKRRRSRLRKASATRPSASWKANIKVPRSQEEREASPVPQGNLHGVPDTMLPIVLVHCLPSTLLDKLDKENSGRKTGLQGVKGTSKVTGKKRATSNGGVVRRAKSAIMKPLVVKLFKDQHSKMVETDSQECSLLERNSSPRCSTRRGSVSSTGTLSSAFSQLTKCSKL